MYVCVEKRLLSNFTFRSEKMVANLEILGMITEEDFALLLCLLHSWKILDRQEYSILRTGMLQLMCYPLTLKRHSTECAIMNA